MTEKKYNITADQILVYTISNAINKWIVDRGGRGALDYCMGIDRCAAISEVVSKCLPEARRIIEENKHRLVEPNDKEASHESCPGNNFRPDENG